MVNVVKKAARAGSLCLEVLTGLLLGPLRGASSDLALHTFFLDLTINLPGRGEVRRHEAFLLVKLGGHTFVMRGLFPGLGSCLLS